MKKQLLTTTDLELAIYRVGHKFLNHFTLVLLLREQALLSEQGENFMNFF